MLHTAFSHQRMRRSERQQVMVRPASGTANTAWGIWMPCWPSGLLQVGIDWIAKSVEATSNALNNPYVACPVQGAVAVAFVYITAGEGWPLISVGERVGIFAAGCGGPPEFPHL